MSTSKHENFFLGKNFNGLIKLIVGHRINIKNPQGDEWYNALIEHINRRDIPESGKLLLESAINDDLESLKENIAIKNILIKSTEDLNIHQVDTQPKREPLTNLNLEKKLIMMKI